MLLSEHAAGTIANLHVKVICMRHTFAGKDDYHKHGSQSVSDTSKQILISVGPLEQVHFAKGRHTLGRCVATTDDASNYGRSRKPQQRPFFWHTRRFTWTWRAMPAVGAFALSLRFRRPDDLEETMPLKRLPSYRCGYWKVTSDGTC